jgi:hypothetical protein
VHKFTRTELKDESMRLGRFKEKKAYAGGGFVEEHDAGIANHGLSTSQEQQEGLRVGRRADARARENSNHGRAELALLTARQGAALVVLLLRQRNLLQKRVNLSANATRASVGVRSIERKLCVLVDSAGVGLAAEGGVQTQVLVHCFTTNQNTQPPTKELAATRERGRGQRRD